MEKSKTKKYDKIDVQYSENTIINIKKNEILDNLDVNGFNNDIIYKEYIHESCDCKCCWNCSHDININVSIPLKYSNNIFYIYGNFCSYGCAARYIIETYNDKNMWDIYSLLNLYYNISNNNIGKKVNP